MSMDNQGEIISAGKTPDSSTTALRQSYQQSHLVAKQEDLGEGNKDLAARSIFVHTSNGFLTFHKILRHEADGFTSPPKEVVLRIFMATRNPSLSAGNEPANLGFNDKHAIRYTTEDDCQYLRFYSI
jgi:hypothetical protein